MADDFRRERDTFTHYLEIATRWSDNDVYGHVNNATYYSYFDTLVNRMLIERNLLDPAKSAAIGVVVETGCRFFASLSFPDAIDAGLRVSNIGNSSVRYEIALFRRGEKEPAATGHFVHVYVDRATRRPVPVPAEVRAALEPLIR
ncbi:MAG: acyl-CoA thioesterase [Myxococcales bacterium]